jgi:CRISPR/Cas system-associated endonuclease/helicase Cas3
MALTFNGAECPDKDIPGKMVPFKPREYQIESAYKLIKYRKSSGEISTSGGKTLISFMIFKYLIDCCYAKKILYIVPSVDLAT